MFSEGMMRARDFVITFGKFASGFDGRLCKFVSRFVCSNALVHVFRGLLLFFLYMFTLLNFLNDVI